MIITERYPQCDRCHSTFPDYRQNDGTLKALREAMERDGWRVIVGFDVCPDCVEPHEKSRKK